MFISRLKMRRILAAINVGENGTVKAKTISVYVPSTTGKITSLPTFNLVEPVSYVKSTGSSDISIASNGDVSTISAIASNTTVSVTGIATGSDHCAIAFTVNLVGQVYIPAAPTLTLVAGNKQVVLNWTDGSTGGSPITTHYVYRGETTSSMLQIATVSGLTYTDTSVETSKTYYYKVSAINAIGESPASSTLSVRPIVAPAAPVLTVTRGDQSNTLTWVDGSNGGAPLSSRKIYRGTVSGSLSLLTTLTTETSFVDSSLTNGTQYFYQMSVVNDAGEGLKSTEVSGTPAGLPSTPTVTLTPGDGQVSIAWTDNSANGSAITAHKLYRGVVSGSEVLIGTIMSGSPYLDTGLTNSVNYYYRLSAVNGVGEGNKSSTQIGRPQGLYSPVVARPTVTGTVYTVNTGMTPAAINAVYNSCNSGDCIQFDDGTYDQNLCFPNGYNKAGVIVRAKNIGAYDSDPLGDGGTKHWARFERKVKFEYGADIGGTPSTVSAANVVIHDIHHTTKAGLWPAENASWKSVVNNLTEYAQSLQNFGFITLASTAVNAKILYNEFSMGFGPAKTPLDPTFKYPDANSPATFSIGTGGLITSGGTYTGWGDSTFFQYNRLLSGPYAILGNRVASDLTIYGNYMHDISHCLNSVLPGTGTYLQQHNWMERSYHDFGTISSGYASSPNITIAQEMWIDPVGHPYDAGNPHIDTCQIFWSITGGGTVNPTSIKLHRSMLLATSDINRGAAQFGYFQLSGGNYGASNTNVIVGVAPKIRENISLHTGYSAALALGVSEDAYINRNVAFHRYALNNNTTPVGTQVNVSRIYNAVSSRDNKGYFANNIYEIDVTGWNGNVAYLNKSNNAILGRRDSRLLTESTVFSGYTASCPTNPYQLFQYVKTNSGYTQGNRSSNIADFVLGTPDWSYEDPFLGYADSLEQTPSTLITSNPAWLHGGNAGRTRTITPPAGVEWRVLGVDRTTVLKNWSSTAGTANVDQGYVQLRATSPVQGHYQSLYVDVDGVQMPWNISSVSTAVFPQVRFDGADRFVAAAGALYSVDGSLISIGFRAKFPSSISASTFLFNTVGSGNAAVSVQILNTGLIRFTLRNAAGTIIAVVNHTGSSLCDGNEHTVLFSADVSKTALSDGSNIVIDGVDRTSSTGTWIGGPGVTIGYTKTSGPLQYGFGGTSSLMISGFDVSFFYLNALEKIDPNNVATRSKFNADQLNSDGSGPTGNPALICMFGTDSVWNNAAGINGGTGPKFIAASGSSVVNSNASAPAEPTFTLTKGDKQVTIAWVDGSDNGSAITSHKLYRGTTSGGEVLIGTILSSSPYIDTGLTNGTTYFYKLSAVNGVGESTTSVEQSIIPGAAVSYDYVITQQADWGTIPSNVLTNGGTVGVSPGTYQSVTLTMRPTATLKFVATDTSNKPVLNKTTFQDVNNLWFDYITFTTDSWQLTPTPARSWRSLSAGLGNSNVKITNCNTIGNYRGTIDYNYDPVTNNIPEYASILPVFDGTGAVTGFTIQNSYVGDLLANGTYSMVFTSVSGFVTFTSSPVATFTVSNGVITGTTLTSGGASNATTATNVNTGGLSKLISWSGQQVISQYMPYADAIVGGSGYKSTGVNVGKIEIYDTVFRLFGNGFKMELGSETIIQRNTFDLMYQDAISFSVYSPTQKVDISWNTITRFFNKAGDPMDPHADGVQSFMTGTPGSSIRGFRLIGNILYSGLSRGSNQGFFISDPVSPAGYGGVVVGNIVLNQGLGNSLVMDNPDRAYIYGNVLVRQNTSESGNSRTVTLNNRYGTALLGKNISEVTAINSVGRKPDTSTFSNVMLGSGGGIIPYTTVFPNFDTVGVPTTVSQVFTKIQRSVGYASSAITGMDYTNHTIDFSQFPYMVQFDKLPNQASNATITSAWEIVLGPPGTVTFACTNGQIQVADDVSGTNATAAASSGSFTTTDWNQKFIRVVNHTTANGASTAATSGVTLNSTSYLFTTITTAVSSYPTADNNAVAYSRFTAPASVTSGLSKLLVAMRWREDAVIANSRLFGSTSSTYTGMQRTSTDLRFSLTSSCAPRWTTSPGSTMHTYVIAIDYNALDLESGAIAYMDYQRLSHTAQSAFSAVGTGATFTTSNLFGGTTGRGWGINAGTGSSTTAVGLTNGACEFFWCQHYTAAETMPDITDPDVIAAFSADRLNTNDGSSSLFGQPRWFYHGTAAEWNAGMANKGSATAPLTTYGGSYT